MAENDPENIKVQIAFPRLSDEERDEAESVFSGVKVPSENGEQIFPADQFTKEDARNAAAWIARLESIDDREKAVFRLIASYARTVQLAEAACRFALMADEIFEELPGKLKSLQDVKKMFGQAPAAAIEPSEAPANADGESPL